jgi:hypothetical protein
MPLLATGIDHSSADRGANYSDGPQGLLFGRPRHFRARNVSNLLLSFNGAVLLEIVLQRVQCA